MIKGNNVILMHIKRKIMNGYNYKRIYIWDLQQNQKIREYQTSKKTTANMLLFKIPHLKPVCKNNYLSTPDKK